VECCLKKNSDQRLSVKELLKHKYVAKSKKTSRLVELTDRYQEWKLTQPDEESIYSSSSDSEHTPPQNTPNWIFETLKEKPNILHSVIYKALGNLLNTDDEQIVLAVSQLKGAFDMAEEQKPGFAEKFLANTLKNL